MIIPTFGKSINTHRHIENIELEAYNVTVMKKRILKYDVVFEGQPDGGYTATVPSLPGCISEGNSLNEAKTNIAEAITAYLESLAKDGEKIPDGDEKVFIEQVSIQNPLV